MGLTPKQEKFVQGLFRGLSQRSAYKEAFENSVNWKDNTIDSRAYELAKNSEIIVRLEELRNQVASKNIMSEIELQEFWTRVIKEQNEMKDKLKASELLGKNKKMFTDKLEHSGEIKNNPFEGLTTDELKKLIDK